MEQSELQKTVSAAISVIGKYTRRPCPLKRAHEDAMRLHITPLLLRFQSFINLFANNAKVFQCVSEPSSEMSIASFHEFSGFLLVSFVVNFSHREN